MHFTKASDGGLFSGVPFYKIILINITNKNKTMTNPMVNSKIITVVLFLVMWKRAVLLNLPWKLYSLIFCYQWPWPWNLPILLVLTKGRVKGSQLVGCSWGHFQDRVFKSYYVISLNTTLLKIHPKFVLKICW